MRCSKFIGNVNKRIGYTCGRCALFYQHQETLLEHLYWRHGTESEVCKSCGLKKWAFAFHTCHRLPNVACANKGRGAEVDGNTKSSNLNDFGTNYSVPHKDPKEVLLAETVIDSSSDDSSSDNPSSDDSASDDDVPMRQTKFCYCGKHIEGSLMIGCDDDSCVLEWYHYQCVGLNVAPAGDWFCPECLKQS